MSDIQELTEDILKFRNERGWKNSHTPKNSAISLSLEAAELLEHFQWKDGEDLLKDIKRNKKHIGDELADVLYWVLLMAYDLEIDLRKSFKRKMRKNAKKYPPNSKKTRAKIC